METGLRSDVDGTDYLFIRLLAIDKSDEMIRFYYSHRSRCGETFYDISVRRKKISETKIHVAWFLTAERFFENLKLTSQERESRETTI